MGWLFAIVVLILLVVSAGFRKAALALVVVCAIGGGIYYLFDRRQVELSKSRVSPDQVEISDGHIGLQYGSYHFTGRITNKSSQFAITELHISVTVNDCAEPHAKQKCATIGDTVETIYIHIPPGQARDFDESLYFPGGQFSPKGELDWQYKISGTRAAPPAA